MIDFFSFKPTDQEVETIFGRTAKEVKADPHIGEGSDWEIYQTACLLAMRGENKEALRIIKEIKDDQYREEMKTILVSQIELPQGAVW